MQQRQDSVFFKQDEKYQLRGLEMELLLKPLFPKAIALGFKI